MQVFEESENFGLDHIVFLSALKRRLKQLATKRIKANLVLEEPTEFRGRQVNLFSLEVSNKCPEPSAELTQRSPGFR